MASLRNACFFLVLFLIARTQADQCSLGCHGVNPQKGGFLEGHAYAYTLEGSSVINLSGADHQKTDVKISAQATVYGLGNCANLLKITSLTITGQDGKKYAKPSDIELPVRFTLQDGVLGSDICSEKGDSQKSLNIKRAVISLLQTATKNTQEVDIFGVCPTSFVVSNEGEGQIIHKTRDLNSCANREHAKQDLLTYVTNPESEIKNSNILKSDLNSDVVLKNGVVEKVEVNENYLYRPFSVGDHGVKGFVKTKFVLRSTNKGTLTAQCIIPKSIIFENPHIVNTDGSNVNNIVSALKVATDSVKDHVEGTSASKFVALVRTLRVSSKADLNTVYGQIQGDTLSKKIFLDALFRTGTGDSIEFSINLLQGKKLSKFEQRLVLASLSSVRHASSSSLKAATALLDNEDLPLDVYLGVGALAGSYCREHLCHGLTSQDQGLHALSNKFASKLGDCKSGSRKAEDLKLAVLKGIRNIGHIEDSLVDKLAHCASDKTVKQRIRVAAIEAFHADPCISKLKQAAIDILKDRQQDSEVRIKAYLTLVDCPCNNVAKEITALVEDEPVYQVGAFITSSLNNIRASTNPNKEKAKKFLGSIKPHKHYPLNIAKFSQNYELSYEMNSAGIGSAVEGNVIFSQDSYLPRSVNLNLTTEIFGRQINLFELGVRQGNLDRLFEEHFGPQSAWNTDTPQQLYTSAKKTVDTIVEKLLERTKKYKTKRDVQKQIASIGKKLRTNIEGYNGNLDLDVAVKLFGVESIFLSLGDDHPQTFEALVDKAFDFFDAGVDKAKTFAHDVHTNLVFLDMELAYPTSTGITMKLNLEGALSSKVVLGGNLDIKRLIQDPKNTKIELKVIPSANVEIIGSLSFDADSVVQGLKTVMSLQTSTGSHVVFKTSDHGFDMQIGLPIEKQELLTASSNIFFFKREKGFQDLDDKARFDRQNWSPFQTGCFDQLASTLGLTLCADMSIPKTWDNENKNKLLEQPFFPLSGNAALSIKLEKENLNAYHIKGNRVVKDGVTSTDLDINVEGPKKSNKINLKFETAFTPKLYSILAKLDSSPYKWEVYAGVKTAEEEYSVDTHLIGNDNVYSFKAGFFKPDANTYKPLLDYRVGSSKSKPVTVDGVVKYEKSGNRRKYSFNDVSLNLDKEKFAVNGFLSHGSQPAFWDMDLKFTNQEKFGTLKGKYEEKSGATAGFVEFHNSLNPVVDFKLDANYHHEKDNEEKFDISVVHGEDSKSTTNKISFSSFYQRKLTEPKIYIRKTKLTYPLHAVVAKFDVEFSPKNFEVDLEGEYQKNKAEFEVQLKSQMKNPGDGYGKLKAKVLDKGIELELQYDEETKTKGNFFAKAEFKPQGKHEVSGHVVHKNEPDDREYALVATYKHGGKADNYKADIGYSHNPNGCKSHTKLSVGSVVHFDFVAEVKRPANSGTLKIILKDAVNAQGQFKINPDHKGHGLFIVDFTKWDRKVKLESNFFFSNPTYNFNIDFYPNSGKDDNSKLTFSTNNAIKEGSYDSKNALVINGEKHEVNLKGSYSGKFENGACNGHLEFILHNGKSVSFNVVRKMTLKNDVLSGTFEVSSVYTPSKDATPYKAFWKGKLNTYNKATRQLDGDHHINIVQASGKDFDLKINLKKTPKNDRTQADIKIDAAGSLLNNRANAFVSFDYFNGKNDAKSDINYRIKGTYGDKASLEYNGAFFFDVEDNKNKQVKNDFDLHVVLSTQEPFEIKITSKDLFIVPQEEHKYFEFISSTAAQVNGNSYKYDGTAKINEKDGSFRLSAEVPNYKKVAMDSSYKNEKHDDGSIKQLDTFSFEYGDGQHLKIVLDSHRQPGKEGQFVITADPPSGFNVKKIVTNVSYKTPADKAVTGDLKIDIDGKIYALSSNINMVDKHDSTVEFKASYPDGKPARVFVHAWKAGSNQYKADSKFENIGTFNLDLTVDAKVQSPEAFDVKIYANSEKLHLNKINFEASTDITKEKKIQFSATENGKNILSGTTTLQSREEGNKFIIEGSGNIKLKNEQKSTSFKYIKDKLQEETESGYEVFFNVALDEKNVVIEHKFTNKEYKLSTVYCETKKQCANIEIKNKLDTSITKTLHNMEFGFDLRKLGLAPEFALRTSTELERFKLPLYNLDIHMSQDKFKYHVQAYAKPDAKKNAYLTALIWTTPNRDVSLESTTSLPESSKHIFPLQHETVFFFNKNDPSTKTLFRISQDVKGEEKKFASSTSEILFTSPALGKDLHISTKSHYDFQTMEISYESVFDIFKKKSQKVVATLKFHPQVVKDKDLWKSKVSYTLDAHIDGKALGYEVTANEKFTLSADGLELSSQAGTTIDKQKKDISLKLNINKHDQLFNVKLPHGELINYNCKCNHAEGSYKMDATLSILQEKTFIASSEVTWSPKYEFLVVLKAKGQPGELKVFGKAASPKKVEFGAKYLDGKKTEDLVHFQAGVEGKPKVDWKFNSKSFKPVLEKATQNIKDIIAKASKSFEEYPAAAKKEFSKITEANKAAAPDFKQFFNTYQQELEKIATELKADKSLANFADAISKVILTVNKIVIDISHKYIEIAGKTNEAVLETIHKLADIWTSKILPELTNLAEKAGQAFLSIASAVLEVVSNYAAYLSDFFDKHSAEFKPIVDDVVKIVENSWKVVDDFLTEVRHQVKEIFESAKEQLEQFPLVQTLHDKLDEQNIPQTLLQIAKDITAQLKSFSTTDELRAFFDTVLNYIEKKLLKQTVDDLDQLTLIYKKAIAAYDSLINKDDITLPQISVPDYSFFTSWESKFPSLTPPEFSIINHIINGNFPDPLELFKAYRPRGFFNDNFIPPYDLQAIVAGGQHIFTFDGRHLTYPGSCKYVLSQDAVDGNFSIVLNLEKGAAKSIILWDKSGDEVEVNAHDLLVKGKKHGFPLTKSNIQAYRRGNYFVIDSKYGVHIGCSNNLDLCYFEISGFYFGKLRGLLGDGNNEPFDDFRTPDGAISTSVPEFGKAYGLGLCEAPKTLDHSFHDHGDKHADFPMCNEVFGKDSPLRIGDIAVNIKNYKQACEHAVTANEPNVKDEVCLIARAYQLALRKSDLYVPLPNTCSQCTLDGKTYEPEEEVPFKLPQKQADIVLAIETTKANENTFKELAIPLISSLVDELKSKKIDDIKVSLVGLSPKNDYPVEYDIENNKLKGNKIVFTDENRNENWQSPLSLENDKYDEILNKLAHFVQIFLRELGVDNFNIAYIRLGASINWRPKAVKSYILFHSGPYVANPILQQFNDVYGDLMVKNLGATAHLFAPLESLTAKGAKENSVIGFSENHVFVMGCKKRGQSHPELRSSVQYDEDSAVQRVQHAHGNAFSTKTFFALNGGDRKKYITLATQAIADSLVEVEQEVVCTCSNRFHLGEGKLKCKTSNTKDKRTKK